MKGQIRLVRSIEEFYQRCRNLLVDTLEFLQNQFDPSRVPPALRQYVKHQRNNVQQDYRKSFCSEVCDHLFSIRNILFKHHCHIYLSMT